MTVSEPPEMKAARATMLVVDDDAELRDWLGLELRRRGFDVAVCGSCDEAVAVLQRRQVDLALLDLWMPKRRDGLQTMQALKAIDPDLVVVMITGHATVPAAVAAMQNGAYDFIQKPFVMGDLLIRLERALERRHLQGVAALHEAGRRLLAARGATEVVDEALVAAREVLSADVVAVVAVPPAAALLRVHPAEGLRRPPDAALLWLSERAVTALNPVQLPESRADRQLQRKAPGFSGAIAFPLAARDGPIGALMFLRGPDQPAFTTTEVRRGLVFAGQVALALDNARLHDELRARVDELTAARKTMLRHEKLAVTGQLAAGIAHEVNNPLCFVASNLSFIVSGLEGGETPLAPMEELLAAAREAHEGAERIRLIVRGLKTFSRADEEQHALVDLRRVLDWALSILRAEYHSRAKVVLDFPEPLFVDGNEPRLGQVFVNLLVNALQAFGTREESLNEVVVSARRDGALVVIAVRDNGVGISPENLERIFEPFFTTKPMGEGTGLGLPICHEIVTGHGGQITVHSRPGEGTTFTVRLPGSDTQLQAGPRALQA